jgi:hypothetical protein
MRYDWFDRSAAQRRLGMRRAALAAWTVVLVLFAVVVMVPGAPAHRPTNPDRAIASLVAHSVQPVSDSCPCDDFAHQAMAYSPSLC